MARPVVYNNRFFAGHADLSRSSADRISAIVAGLVPIGSVIDVGCGIGTWLAAFKRRGSSWVLGIDGHYVARELLQIDASEFIGRDLRQPLDVGQRFDLAVSLEVAEHLPAERGPSLVAELTAIAPAILFSAAIPRQGGTGHINERWQDYWAGLFDDRGYRPVDCVRAPTWDDPAVAPWYAQNTLLYLAPEVEVEAEPMDALPLRVVHPNVFLKQLDEPLPPRGLARVVGRSLGRTVREARRRVLDGGPL